MNNTTLSDFILASIIALIFVPLAGWNDPMVSGLLMLAMFLISLFALYRIHKSDPRQWFQYVTGSIITVFWVLAFMPGEESDAMLFLVVPYLVSVLWISFRVRKLPYHYDQH